MTQPYGGSNPEDERRSGGPEGSQWPPTGQDHLMPYEAAYPPYPQGGAYPGYGYPPPGYPPPAYPPSGYPQRAPSNPLGVAGFVTGLCGVVLFFVPFLGLLLGITGTTLGGMGMDHGRRAGAGSGLAIAGLVLGIIAIGLGVIVVISLVTGNYN